MRDFKGYKDVVYTIIGAAMKVHSTLRWGLLEAVYQEALVLELADQGVKSEKESLITCFYKNHELEKKYKMDMLVGDVIVEMKSVSDIQPAHRAQLFNYLRLTKRPVGVLINFGTSTLQGERYAYIEETNECRLLDRDMNLLYDDVDWDKDS